MVLALGLIVYGIVRLVWAVLVAAVIAAWLAFMFLAYGIAKVIVWLRAS